MEPTETEHAAAKAWSLMFWHAMPAGVAIDYIQEPTGNRSAAVAELIAQAVRNLRKLWPQEEPLSFVTSNSREVGLAILNWTKDCVAMDNALARLTRLCTQLNQAEERGMRTGRSEPLCALDIENWRTWCRHAERTIALCREIIAGDAQ